MNCRSCAELIRLCFAHVIRIAWFVSRASAFALLVIVEPIVRVLFSALALISLGMCVFFELFTVLPAFPSWSVLAVALASFALLVTYYRALKLLMRR